LDQANDFYVFQVQVGQELTMLFVLKDYVHVWEACEKRLVPWYHFQFLCLRFLFVALIPGCNEELFIHIHELIVTSRHLETPNLESVEADGVLVLGLRGVPPDGN